MKTKFYKQIHKNNLHLELKKNFLNVQANNVIVAYLNNIIVGSLEFEENENIVITKILNDMEYEKEIFQSLFSKLILINHLKKDLIFDKSVYEKYKDYLKNIAIVIDENQVLVKVKDLLIRKFIEFGRIKTGRKNNICDVEGVKVGHFSINTTNSHTGVTAILPHSGNLFKEKVIGASFVYNGFGKSIGLVQIDELGTIETPILLTNTLNVGKVADGLVEYTLDHNPEIGVSTGTLNPIVLECNDGSLNDIRSRVLDKSAVFTSINNATTDFIQGSIGAGSGMTCHGYKGGIGSASRIISIEGQPYTIGVLVNSNFLGGSPKHLIINNHFLGDKLTSKKEENDKGSIIIVVATDLPVSERQLKRILKRAVLGIGKTGGFAGNGSGDIVVGFSTANIIKHYEENAFINIKTITDEKIDKVFKATVDATEEAIINSLLYSKTTKGIRGNEARSIMEEVDLFDDLFIENIFEEKE